jgi:adenylylsulfate kinase
MIYWFTGQPGSGKSTLAAALKAVLQARGSQVVCLDGEELREITGNKDFSETGRLFNVKIGQRLAKKLAAEGIVVVASFVSPHRWLREEFKKDCDVIEIYVHTTRPTDREAYFVKAYEPPVSDFVDVDTTSASIEECVQKIIAASP